MLEQSDGIGVELDCIYHTIGTGTALRGLPGLPAAKLSLGHPVQFRSISIQRVNDGDRMNPGVMVERTKAVLTTLGARVPDDATIRAEIDIELLDHARSGRIPVAGDVAFLHTGDTGNLFEISQVVGHITE